jgi:putative DNA primase/helicase
VIEALRERGLWPARERRDNGTAGGGEWITWRDDIRYPTGWGRIVREYVYRDATGREAFSTFRLNPKDFRIGHRDTAGKWTWKQPAALLPYHLPELIAAPMVCIAEGERDVEALREWGFAATCNPGGAGKWRAEWGPLFRGKTVLILPDDDEPGVRHARQVAEALLPYAARLGIVRLPGVKDASEWFERGHGEVEMCRWIDAALAPWEVEHAA